MNHILEINNLEKQFPGFHLQNINFTLESGYIMGLIGPNGAGKTTLIKLLMGLLHPDNGEIRLFGERVSRENLPGLRERIGFVYDENCFYEELTVGEMAGVIAPFYRRWDTTTFRSLRERFQLAEKKRIKDLSRGMKTKFALAVALSHHPELIIMDEPTSGLDPVFRSEILELLREIMQEEHKGILFSTHITTDLDQLADFVTYLSAGRIVFSNSREEISDTYQLVKGDMARLSPEVRAQMIGCKITDFHFTGLTKEKGALQPVLGESALWRRPTLEEIMIYHERKEKSHESI